MLKQPQTSSLWDQRELLVDNLKQGSRDRSQRLRRTRGKGELLWEARPPRAAPVPSRGSPAHKELTVTALGVLCAVEVRGVGWGVNRILQPLVQQLLSLGCAGLGGRVAERVGSCQGWGLHSQGQDLGVGGIRSPPRK